MSISFFIYVKNGEGYDFPNSIQGKTSYEIIPNYGTMDYDIWMHNDLEIINPNYDSRLDINMTNRNAHFVLNELGMDVESDPLLIDVFEAGLKATLERFSGELIPGLPGYINKNIHSFGVEDGYANNQMGRMLSLVEAAREYGATHIGWG